MPRWLLLLAAAALCGGPAPAVHASTRTFDVSSFGAVGDAKTDDTAAIQRAIDAAEAAGGGVVRFAARTYLLDSWHPSSHPWMFYNLIAGSHVALSGRPGARLLQGPHGRHAILPGATEVRNTVLAFGRDYTTICYQRPQRNGGFVALSATRAGVRSATLARASDAARFHAGDCVAVLARTTGDVIPTETARVTSVDRSAGVLRLAAPLSRAFAAPVVANVTRLATVAVGVSDLTLQGAEPLAATEVFGFVADNVRFVSETSVGDGNVHGLNMNTIDGFRISGCRVECAGPDYAGIELPQRNSRHGVVERTTFDVRQVGFGEYAADWRITDNTFILHPGAQTAVALAFGGVGVLFARNHVRGGNLVGGGGSGSLVSDYVGMDDYAAYAGRIRITDNEFVAQADGNACLGILARDTVVARNSIVVHGSGCGIRVEGPLPQTTTIKNNRVVVESGIGIALVTPDPDGAVVTGNAITGSGSPCGIFVASPSSPHRGRHIIRDNHVVGCAAGVTIDGTKHPRSVVSGN